MTKEDFENKLEELVVCYFEHNPEVHEEKDIWANSDYEIGFTIRKLE